MNKLYRASKLETSPSPVTMVKSREKKCQNYFRSIMKCHRNVNFEEVDTEHSAGKTDGF